MTTRWERLRPWLPLGGGAALALVGVAALGVASQGLTLTVSPPPAPATEVDPLALLRADQAATQDEVRALGDQLEALVRALEEASAADQAARARELAAVAARVEGRLEVLEARLAGLAAPGTGAAAGPAPPATTSAPAPAPTATEPVVAPTSTEPAPAPATTEPAAAAASSRGVFSFRLERGLDLDERLRFEVIASLSRVGFDAKSTLHDFSGVTSDVSGWVEARLADPGRDGRGQVTARAATLRTGVDGRDEELRRRLDVERHPELRFDWSGFELERLDRDAAKLRGHAVGTLTVRGVARPLRVPVTVEVDPQRRLVVAGEARLRMSDHGVEPPDLGVIVVEDEVKVWLALRLRALGEARRQ